MIIHYRTSGSQIRRVPLRQISWVVSHCLLLLLLLSLSLSSSISFDLGCTQMAESHLQTPLLTQNHHTQNHHTRTSSDYEPHLSLSIDSDQNFCNRSHENDQFEHENPFEFLGVDGFSIPPSSTADPFRNHTPRIEGIYEFVKIVICLPIAALRLVLFGLGLCIGYLATLIALLGWKDKHNPIPRWRCRFMWISRFCARCILFSFGYQWIKRKGHPAPREIAPIVVSNHVSYIEPIFFFYELFPTIVASESHDSLPVVGTIIRAMQVIYVNRFSSSSRKNAVDEIKRKASCNSYPRVLLFPEGTTTNGRFLISFQRGAFVPGFPIQPVIVRYPYVHFDQSWGNVSVAKLMFRMFTQFHNFMEVEYLPVIQSLQCPNDSVPIFAERTAYAMATALNVVQTSHAYGDMMLLVKAQESKQENPSRFMVELAHRDLGYHISTEDALEFLEKFLSMNPDNSGSINFEDFLRALRLKPCSLSEKIFAFVDVNRTGRIDFKQFLLASTKIMKQPLFQRALELSFARCRTGALDHISQKEIAEVIRGVIPNATHDDVRELSALLDVDGDGRISKQDFFNCLTRNPLLIALFSPLLNNISHSSNGILEETV